MPVLAMQIRAAAADEMDHVRTLFREYATWLQEDICLQSLEQELASLPGSYGPPRGSLLIAARGESIGGCVALRELDPETAEMKRLFVRPSFRGIGLGEKLIAAIAAEARVLGYKRLRLDTLPKMDTAQKLYEKLGFRDIARYNSSPVAGTRFMELTL
jgi:putative acetyltransferase